jgi:hypothetical protein
MNDLELFPRLRIPILSESKYYDLMGTAHLSGGPEAKLILEVTDLADCRVGMQDTCKGLGRTCWLPPSSSLGRVHED